MAFIADAYDAEKIHKGQWFDYQGSRFLIARSDNDAFRKASGEAERARLMAKPEDRKFGPDLHDENLRIAAAVLFVVAAPLQLVVKSRYGFFAVSLRLS